MSDFTIVGGKLKTLDTITQPSDTKILADARFAAVAGIGLSGQGPYRAVTGVCLSVVVGPTGCSCCVARNGLWCLHRSMYLVQTGAVVAPKPTPAPIAPSDKIIPLKPHRERRGWSRRPFPLGQPRQPIPFRPRMK